jgi:hypothetical protein
MRYGTVHPARVEAVVLYRVFEHAVAPWGLLYMHLCPMA